MGVGFVNRRSRVQIPASAPYLALVGTLSWFTFGCAQPPPDEPAPPPSLPRQTEVIDLIWHGLLDELDDPPVIEWVPGEQCKGLRDPSIIVGTAPNIICAAGTYADNAVKLVVPARSPSLDRPFGPYNSSAIVHELVHAYLDRMQGDPDSSHRRFPDAWELVPTGNELLIGVGL